ncbi:Angiopoietin-1 receptor [Paramuricea clavata]|uniref:Angiopoietin-1 receptor n=1 Tax=Paramuricea clavata TaxID=317549 RepID=A0A6S7GLI7_PARCT|nr:Angiopoietin-1 receptor [Paramuricea clavata]
MQASVELKDVITISDDEKSGQSGFKQNKLKLEKTRCPSPTYSNIDFSSSERASSTESSSDDSSVDQILRKQNRPASKKSKRRGRLDNSSSSSDDDNECRKQRKIGPLSWSGIKVEKVDQVPAGIDGLKRYELANDKANIKDGRRWKKASQSQWNGYESVRYRDCWGSLQCQNEQCDFRKEYGVTNRTHFDGKSGNRATEDVQRKVAENPDATPAQIQSSLILSKMRECRDWLEVEQAAISLSDKKWISTEKQKMKKATNHLLWWKENDRKSFVFKTSKLKAKFALNMDQSGEHILNNEFCYFDGKVKRCKGFVSLTASVYHPLMRKLVPLATMECNGENTSTISLFWNTFNDVLKKESGNDSYVFNPRGWITDMAGANMEGIKTVFGTSAVDRIKTCEFHFKDCRNRQARKLDEHAKDQFKRMCNALIEAESPGGYEAAKENIENFIRSDDKLSFLQSWFDWWDKRRNLISPAYLHVRGGSKMNQAEAIHTSWVKRDRMNLSLLDAAQADVRDNVLLEVDYKAFQNGSGKGGKGPSIQTQTMRDNAIQMNRARNLGLELIREDIADTDRIRVSEHSASSNPHDRHNGSVQRGPRRSDGERNGRYRPTRSKTFLNRLRNAKEEKDTIKVKDPVTVTEKDFERSYTLVTNSFATYKVSIGKKHSCQCMDFSKNEGKELCKHIISILLYVCRMPEESELLQQVFLTDAECSEIFGNIPPVPNGLKYVPGARNQSRQDIVASLLLNDRRNCQPRVWVLKRKEMQRGTIPRCRCCRKEQHDGDLCVSVVGLYVPYEQNFVVETTFYFCPSANCVRHIPPWINLTPPSGITVDSSVTREEIENLRDSPLKDLLIL